jgi:hypothetical protein
MPYYYRFYIDKEIVQNEEGITEGGDHVRVVDVMADEKGMGAARRDVEGQLASDEVIGNAAQIMLDNPDDPTAVPLHFASVGEGRWTMRSGEDSP